MPTYEYRCRGCGHEFERFQNMSASPVRTCPSCKKRRVERLISAGGGIVFKGAGFYATDYRKDGPKGGGASDSSGTEGDSVKKSGEGSSGEGSAGEGSSGAGSAGEGSSGAKPEKKTKDADS